MSAYRLYAFNGERSISSVTEIHAKNDEDAIMIARAQKSHVTSELWDRDRLVATIPAAQD